jgi:hypothetical protein
MGELDGPWYVTRTASEQYARMFYGSDAEEHLEDARKDLIEAAKGAHKLEHRRVDRQDLEMWRASGEWHRIRFLVGKAPAGMRGGRPSLVRVLPPYDGWQYRAEEDEMTWECKCGLRHPRTTDCAICGETFDPPRTVVPVERVPESERPSPAESLVPVIEKVVAGLGFEQRQRALALALWRTAAHHPMISCCADFVVRRVVLRDGGEEVSLDVGLFPQGSKEDWYFVDGVRYCSRCRSRRCTRQVGGSVPCKPVVGKEKD